MNELIDAINTLAHESGGGGNTLEALEPQGIRGIALFLADGRVAVFPVEAAHD